MIYLISIKASFEIKSRDTDFDNLNFYQRRSSSRSSYFLKKTAAVNRKNLTRQKTKICGTKF